MQMPADARPLPHPRLTLHADVYICIPTEDPLHGFHPSACMSVKIDAFPCMCMQMDTSGRRWMTASIILFAIHRCMGCT